MKQNYPDLSNDYYNFLKTDLISMREAKQIASAKNYTCKPPRPGYETMVKMFRKPYQNNTSYPPINWCKEVEYTIHLVNSGGKFYMYVHSRMI
jgi:hypothetical protein